MSASRADERTACEILFLRLMLADLPKNSVAQFIGVIKGKSAVVTYNQVCN